MLSTDELVVLGVGSSQPLFDVSVFVLQTCLFDLESLIDMKELLAAVELSG